MIQSFSLHKTRDNILRASAKSCAGKATMKAQNSAQHSKTTGLGNLMELMKSRDMIKLESLGIGVDMEVASTYMSLRSVVLNKKFVYGSISCKDQVGGTRTITSLDETRLS